MNDCLRMVPDLVPKLTFQIFAGWQLPNEPTWKVIVLGNPKTVQLLFRKCDGDHDIRFRQFRALCEREGFEWEIVFED